MRESKKMNLLFERLESIQSMIFPPTLFDEKVERELNLSEEFVDSCVIAYGLVDELLAIVAASRTTYADVIARWKAIESEADDNEYTELSKSEFGRVVIHLIESAIRLK
ncbi:hypothetical protein ACSYDW_08605 [Paeniglutamicibacter sp. R2-26]|uniref:hypothetical protein n=1 Tax=Paeniglutamicibacter sp. R2-26 TaxID=3144417 RepID=UPI003EE48681